METTLLACRRFDCSDALCSLLLCVKASDVNHSAIWICVFVFCNFLMSASAFSLNKQTTPLHSNQSHCRCMCVLITLFICQLPFSKRHISTAIYETIMHVECQTHFSSKTKKQSSSQLLDCKLSDLFQVV